MGHTFCVVSKKSLPNPWRPRFSILSYRSFIVLCFKLRSTIYFELIFVKGIGLCIDSSSFFFLHIQVYQHHLLKRVSFLQWIAFHPLQISVDYICGGLFQGSHSVTLIYLCIPSPISHCLNFKITFIFLYRKYTHMVQNLKGKKSIEWSILKLPLALFLWQSLLSNVIFIVSEDFYVLFYSLFLSPSFSSQHKY